MKTFMFNLGYLAAWLLGFQDKTWFNDARVFRVLGLTGAEFLAPDGAKRYDYCLTLNAAPDEVHDFGSHNAEVGRRDWVMRASTDDLVRVKNLNEHRFELFADSPVVAEWLDAEYRVVMRELKHRHRELRHHSTASDQIRRTGSY